MTSHRTPDTKLQFRKNLCSSLINYIKVIISERKTHSNQLQSTRISDLRKVKNPNFMKQPQFHPSQDSVFSTQNIPIITSPVQSSRTEIERGEKKTGKKKN